jgi:hypothetical protein
MTTTQSWIGSATLGVSLCPLLMNMLIVRPNLPTLVDLMRLTFPRKVGKKGRQSDEEESSDDNE